MAAIELHRLPNLLQRDHQRLDCHPFWRLRRSIPLLGLLQAAEGSRVEGAQYQVVGSGESGAGPQQSKQASPQQQHLAVPMPGQAVLAIQLLLR
jgi:hypothetical protein